MEVGGGGWRLPGFFFFLFYSADRRPDGILIEEIIKQNEYQKQAGRVWLSHKTHAAHSFGFTLYST